MKEEYFVMSEKELESIPVDAWLIGHTHIPYPATLSETEFTTGYKVFNAGAHTQEDVSNNTEGVCFIIEIDDKKNVKAKKVKTGNIFFKRINLSVEANALESTINDELSNVPDNTVVDLILSGAVNVDEYEDRVSIVERALERFIEGTYDLSNLNKLITNELIDSEFNELTVSSKFLKELIENPIEAQMAYDLIRSLNKGDK